LKQKKKIFLEVKLILEASNSGVAVTIAKQMDTTNWSQNGQLILNIETACSDDELSHNLGSGFGGVWTRAFINEGP
jgi:hypothetical protein